MALATPLEAAQISVVDFSQSDGIHNGSIDLDVDMPSNLRDDGALNCNLRLEGPIEQGDESRLKLASDNLRTKLGDGLRFCLNSPGGSYDEGVKIAELLMRESIGTAIEAGSQCASACALVFMAGTAPWKGQINRFLHVRGRLLFHAPSIDASRLGNNTFKSDDISTSFQAAVRAINRLIKIGGDTELKRFPNELLHEMLDRGPSDTLFEVDTIGKAIRYRIGLYGAHVVGRLSLDQLCNACQNYHYGAMERGVGGCETADKQSAVRRSITAGERIVFEAMAPRGGSCVVDVTGSMSAPLNWHIWRSGGEEDEAFGNVASADTLSLAYWYLYPASAQISSLGNGTSARTSPIEIETRPAAGNASMAAKRLLEYVQSVYLRDRERYAARVDYFDKGIVDNAFIESDKLKYARRWQTRQYTLIPSTFSIRSRLSNEWVVSFGYTYSVASGQKQKDGNGSVQLILTHDGTGFLVIGVKEIVHK